MPVVPLSSASQGESAENSDRRRKLFAEIADLSHVYSHRIEAFFDHGHGHLTLIVESERNSPIKVNIERLSADLAADQPHLACGRHE